MKRILLLWPVLCLLESVHAQNTDNTGGSKSLELCIQYALAHQTNIRQSLIDEQIADRSIKSHLADWYPQINFNGNYQQNFQLQSTVFNNSVNRVGSYNTSAGQFGLTQTIFNRDVLLTKQTANDVRNLAKQNTVNTSIEVIANVSKSFYNVLLSKQQILLLDSDIVLLQRSLQDAYNQYRGGLVDKTDYQRATISLNNTRAQRKSAQEQLKSNYALLKLFMSYPADSTLDLQYDSSRMEQEVGSLDTLQQVDFNNRIEYQQLLTQKRLQQASLKYYRWGFLPSVSAFGEYNLNYYNNQFSKLYSNNYPNSYAGIAVSLPIFQGTRRTQEVRIAQLQLDRLEYNFTSVKDSINTQYIQALASYKANLNNYHEQKENLDLARQVYDVIRLQYRAGIKTYLEVVTANNDLFAAQINFTNAMYEVLSNKIDVERALGTLR
ncbi:MAG: TolC family protein [Bacteroidota bacterium]|nr:TolC family protein [Bacteroidota bacterium]MDP4251591.1 TolC family protein [Bacteroidota bacterium]